MITGYVRIIADTREEAEEIAAYLYRTTGKLVCFNRAVQGRRGEWLCYGEMELPPEEDTRNWKKGNKP